MEILAALVTGAVFLPPCFFVMWLLDDGKPTVSNTETDDDVYCDKCGYWHDDPSHD